METRSRIYSPDWMSWIPPEVPEYFNPTDFLLDKHTGLEKTAVIADGARISYGALRAMVCRAAHALRALGLQPEDRALLFGSDSLELLSTWLGALRCGVVPAWVSELYKAPSLLYFLRDTAATVLFIDEEQLPKLTDIGDSLPSTLQRIVVRGRGGDRRSFDELIADMPDEFEPVPRHRDDFAYMFYSGGTTGPAKGIIHLCRDFALVPEQHGKFMGWTAQDVHFATSRKYFTHGLWPGVLIPLYNGATGILNREPPAPETLIATVERDRPTVLTTVPTVIKNLLLHAEQSSRRPDLSSLRMVTCASEKMPPELFSRFSDHFGLEILDSIGSSEVTYEWIANRPHDFRRGSLGRPVYGVEIRLVDPDGSEVTEPNREGEAWVKSRTVAFCYWRKFEKTKETFVGPWCRTGDTLYFDEEGFFWFSGRGDDLFKVAGLWVSPIEVEAALATNPGVLEAAVIPGTDAEGMTRPKAFVVLKPGVAPSDALTLELKSEVRRQIGGYKVPEWIVYVDSLPRTTLQKIDRRTLREREQSSG